MFLNILFSFDLNDIILNNENIFVIKKYKQNILILR